ncbi:MAG: LuxR C-terminal-related transcriptional regulator [Rubrobacteraceae bacterium]
MSRLSRDPAPSSPAIVLEPKLQLPALHFEQLARPWVGKFIEEASRRKLTLISAPAGYGKTTLLVQWRRAEDAGVPFAWVSLDEQDNDPVRLWRHIVEALRRVVLTENFGEDVLTAIGAMGHGLAAAKLPLLINELATLSHRVVLVLDDYQFVTENDCHELLAFFVDYLPENIHLIISTRSDPPLPLGRMRARGEMNEVRADQLAFSKTEADRLLNERMDLDLEPDDIRRLWNRTEGWPAALYLAALSLQNREDRRAFVESFEGGSGYIVDFLSQEVFADLDEDTREFLLKTSVLRRMTGPLCDAVVGREGSEMLLRELARSNLFVVSLDGRQGWYRYHHLFSEMLFYELRNSRPELVPLLHDRAREWLENGEFFDSAIHHALAGADYECVAALISRHWLAYIAAGQTSTIERWLAALPQEMVARHATLALAKAWISVLHGRREECERWLKLVEDRAGEAPPSSGPVSVEMGVALLQAIYSFGGVQNGADAGRRAAALDPEQTSPLAGWVRLALGNGLYCSGEISQSRKPAEEALELLGTDEPVLRNGVLFLLSSVAVEERRPEEAESHAREAGALVDRFGLQKIPQATLAPIALGRALAEQGRLDEARLELESGLTERGKFSGLSPWPDFLGLLTLAKVRFARGDRSAAREALADARSILEDFPDAKMFHDRLEHVERKLRTRSSRPGGLNEELTGRELDVVGLLAGELSTRQMGELLYLAPSTVRTHVKSIYRKLGVSSRGQAVQEARARGII